MINASPTEVSLEIKAPVECCYHFCRNVEALPHYLHNVMSVHHLYGNVWEWVFKGSEGDENAWHLALERDIPHKQIVWKTVQSPDIEITADVHFQKIGMEETLMSVEITIEPPNCPQKELLKRLNGLSNEDIEKDLYAIQAQIEGQHAQHEAFTDSRGMPSSSR